METWEQRLIDEMYSIIDQLSVCLSRQDPRLQGKLDNLIILCELASYLSKRSRNEEKMEISSELESTIKRSWSYGKSSMIPGFTSVRI